jgi:hypothetical protein
VSRAGVAQAVRAAVSSSQATDALTCCPSTVVRVFGVTAGVAYVPDRVEIARRDAVGLGALTQRDVLEFLMGLPVGLPVASEDLCERERRLLAHTPHGAVENEAGHLIRRVVAPVAARFAVVAASTWREGLGKAGRFAPVCARAVLLPAPPEDLDEARAQATFYGIGICVFTAGSMRMLVEPQPYVRYRHSSAQWWFAEEIYRQVTEAESPRS